jgi:hypothetical protein
MTGWLPIGHRSPYKRISINDPVPVTQTSTASYGMLGQALLDAMKEGEDERKRLEAEKVWRAVVEVSQGNG